MRNERYYYSIMSLDEKKAYRMIYDGVKMCAFNIVVSLYLSPDEVQKVYVRVLYDNPLFYYINQTVIKMQGQPGYWILLPEYLYTKSEINRINVDIRNVIDRIKIKADSFRNNEFRLEKFLHDSVVKSVAYDYDSLKKKDSFNAHSIVGVFLDKRAVCEGIAKAFKLLCNEYGIKCIVVLGQANKEGIYGEDDYHAWNLVRIGDESYYVDVTWDNLYDEDFHHISYDYFNVTTKDILLDHKPIGELPLCSSTRLNYFYSTKSFVSTYEELVGLISQRFGAQEIVFKALKDSGQFLCSDELKEKTFTALMHVMLRKGETKSFSLVFNEMHNVGKIFLSKN
ncbi:MAG: hypothetical protein NC124_08740 [Clostridium sp.]|nr:hypothetical protein [Clostridium sp.]